MMAQSMSNLPNALRDATPSGLWAQDGTWVLIKPDLAEKRGVKLGLKAGAESRGPWIKMPSRGQENFLLGQKNFS